MILIVWCSCRTQHAIDLFKLAQQRTGDLTLHQTYVNQSQKALTEAKKDNDFIYHERVPDVKMLEPIGKAPLAKIMPLSDRLSANFKGISLVNESG